MSALQDLSNSLAVISSGILLVSTCFLASCDSGNDGSGSDSSGSQTAGDSVCADENRSDSFAVGLSRAGSLVEVAFMQATPAPPDRGENTWVVMVTDSEGAPISDADLEVVPWMPDHGHGSSVVVEVEAMQTPGEYRLSPIDLFMAGLWEVRLNFILAGGDEGAAPVEDQVVFSFCVER